MAEIHIAVLGDKEVGKSSIRSTYLNNRFPVKEGQSYNRWDSHCIDAPIEITQSGKDYTLQFYDICGWDTYGMFRPTFYRYEQPDQLRLILICYSVFQNESLTCVNGWVQDIRNHDTGMPVVLVATKIDLRSSRYCTKSKTCYQCIGFDKGYQVAKDNGLYYAETSCKIRHGLEELVELIIDIATKPKPRLIPPSLPLAERIQDVELEASEFADQMSSALKDERNTDVTFIVEGVKKVKCHKVILCSACNFFCQVFGIPSVVELDEAEVPFKFTWSDINEGKVAGLSSITDVEEKGCHVTRIAVSSDISRKIFSLLIDFLYTGLPKLEDGVKIDASILNDLKKVSRSFFLPYLLQIVANREKDEEFLNPSIEAYLNDRRGRRAKALFFGKETFSDVKLNVQGAVIPAHRGFLVPRCRIMADMFDEKKEEVALTDEDPQSFQVLLEYLYTDCASVEGDHMGILVMADKYGQQRLKNLCEFYISKTIDKSITDGIVSDDVNVCEVLHAAQGHNASKLANWCLHFISLNYATFSERSEFKQLEGDNLDYVAKNRWPPEWYLEELKEYEALMAMDPDEIEQEHIEQEHKDTDNCENGKKSKKCEIM